mmetsp:Transcript_1388/g.2230  ORF Transcript_1388/g.2230 Transcript_1388/m.2230 type:complete len:140 (+) Transcript_1388:48-467(+)
MVCSKQHGAVKMLAAQQRCQQQKLYCRYRLRDIRRLRCQIVLRCRSRFGALASRSAASLRGWGGISSPLEPKQRHWFCHEVHGWFLILVVQVSYVLEGFRAIRGGWPSQYSAPTWSSINLHLRLFNLVMLIQFMSYNDL